MTEDNAGQPDVTQPKPYHHGALREALVEATEALLAENGVEGFSLRQAARKAGVSAAASAHHFGSAAGLLTAVAVRSYQDLADALRHAADTSGSPGERLRALGRCYVEYALFNPGRFKLMFRKDLLLDDAGLSAAAHLAYEELSKAMRDYRRDPGDGPDLQLAVIGAWSAVHGFAHLALEGRLLAKATGGDTTSLLDTILPGVLVTLYPDR